MKAFSAHPGEGGRGRSRQNGEDAISAGDPDGNQHHERSIEQDARHAEELGEKDGCRSRRRARNKWQIHQSHWRKAVIAVEMIEPIEPPLGDPRENQVVVPHDAVGEKGRPVRENADAEDERVADGRDPHRLGRRWRWRIAFKARGPGEHVVHLIIASAGNCKTPERDHAAECSRASNPGERRMSAGQANAYNVAMRLSILPGHRQAPPGSARQCTRC